MPLTIFQSHSLLSCFSCCVPTTPDPISKLQRPPQTYQSTALVSAALLQEEVNVGGFLCGTVVIKLWWSYLSLR